MGRLADCHPAHYDLQRPEQGASLSHHVARASGCLQQSLHFLHLLRWIFPASVRYMPVLPANHRQGESLSLMGMAINLSKFTARHGMV